MFNQTLFSKQSDNWTTPSDLYNHFIKRGYFDPCPINSTFDGLSISWHPLNFVNPPYSQISKWVDKCIEEAKNGNHVNLLIPSRTDTKYFHKLMDYGCLFLFFKGRLKFGGKSSAPFPSVLVYIGEAMNNCMIQTSLDYYKEVVQ